MSALAELSKWVTGLASAEATPAHSVKIDPTHVRELQDTAPLRADHDYFRVRVHRVRLKYETQWLQDYSPLLLVGVEFSYDGEQVARPMVVGPSMVQWLGSDAPLDLTLAGTVVAGPHPLRPGGLSITVALHKVARGKVAGGLLDVLQGATSVLDLAAGIAPYTALAGVVVNGLGALTGGDRALMARRDQLTTVAPQYFALINASADVDPATLWVQDGELFEWWQGKLWPYRRADWVLYSIDRVAPEEIDITRLPLFRQWQQVLTQANKAGTPENWKAAKTNLSSLISMAFDSPDLTYEHAEFLERQWIERAVARRDNARRLGEMGQPGDNTAIDQGQARALAVLQL
jgi:hypothetical protein